MSAIYDKLSAIYYYMPIKRAQAQPLIINNQMSYGTDGTTLPKLNVPKTLLGLQKTEPAVKVSRNNPS